MLTGGYTVRATGGLECLLGGHRSQLLPECLHRVQKANEAALEQIHPRGGYSEAGVSPPENHFLGSSDLLHDLFPPCSLCPSFPEVCSSFPAGVTQCHGIWLPRPSAAASQFWTILAVQFPEGSLHT